MTKKDIALSDNISDSPMLGVKLLSYSCAITSSVDAASARITSLNYWLLNYNLFSWLVEEKKVCCDPECDHYKCPNCLFHNSLILRVN